MSSPKILVLGCGVRPRPGAVNVDYAPLPGVDIRYDLNSIPWTFGGDDFDEIVAEDVIEHVDNVVGFMEQCWLRLRPGGKLRIRTVHYSVGQAYTDPTHRHWFTTKSFDYFVTGSELCREYPWYTAVRYKKLSSGKVGHELVFVFEKAEAVDPYDPEALRIAKQIIDGHHQRQAERAGRS